MTLFITLFLFIFVPAQLYAQTCPKNEFWVSGHNRTEYVKSDGTSYSASKVTGYCKSKGPAYEKWPDQLVNGTVMDWPHKNEKFKDWSRSEIELVLKAFAYVPRFLLSYPRIYRADKSETPHNLATSAEKVIVLYDKLFKSPDLMARVLAHELGHEHFREMSDSELTAYLLVAEWRGVKGSKDKFRTYRSSFVAPDGDQSPGEDFANNLEFYIFE